MMARRFAGWWLALAACGLAPHCTGAAPVLGRLFSTPSERAQLDARRAGPPPPAAPEAPATPPPPPAPVVLDGVAQSSKGPATVWVNQTPLPEAARTVRRDRSVTMVLPSGRRVTLKPGQRYDESTGEVHDEGVSGNVSGK